MMKPGNKKQLQRLLKHHVVDGRKMASEVTAVSSMKMLDGTTLKVRSKGDQVRVGEATLTDSDLDAQNGVVHVIDRVLRAE